LGDTYLNRLAKSIVIKFDNAKIGIGDRLIPHLLSASHQIATNHSVKLIITENAILLGWTEGDKFVKVAIIDLGRYDLWGTINLAIEKDA
jgi:hypothetical protein